VNRIISAGQANLGRRPNVMSRLPQRLDYQPRDAVVVKIDFH
jgi:hypothetical protein